MQPSSPKFIRIYQNYIEFFRMVLQRSQKWTKTAPPEWCHITGDDLPGALPDRWGWALPPVDFH